MKKIIFFLFAFVISLFFVECNAVVLDEKGVVLQEVVDIFRQYKPLIDSKTEIIVQKYQISKEEIDTILNPSTERSFITLESLNAIAQTVFLRPENTERKDIINDQFLPYTNKEIMNLFHIIGDIDNVYPKHNCYNYILINGSTIKNMRQRIQTFINFVMTKKINVTDATQIIFLTGERDLFDTENEQQLQNTFPLKLNPTWNQPESLPKTEDQAAEWIWYQSDLPDAIRKANIVFVRAKKKDVVDKKTGNSIKVRPTTYDTIKMWIDEYHPEPNNCLSISSQPYVHYQEITMKGFFKQMNMLAKGFSIDGCGMGDIQDFESFKSKIAIMLDNLTRTIYTELNNSKLLM